jgi:DNA-binding XRE family transcriptional regulator
MSYGLPAAQVASQLGVSRQTVYNWFMGLHEPNEELIPLIKKIIAKYK